jgi:hypothetical protein
MEAQNRSTNSLSFIETSALDASNVELAFQVCQPGPSRLHIALTIGRTN